ncbi:MAG: hypothetical protein ACLR8J_06035 [Sutterella wadsworthensis]
MNMLAALFAGAALLAGAVLAGYRMRTRGPAAAGKSVFLAGFAGVLLVSSLGVYATLGRWSDWDKAEVDHDVDYLLAAKLTDARRLVQMTPDSAYAQQQLALVSLEVGRYEDAVSAIDRSISIAGETPELLGIKVFAQYYRDGRQFAPETQAAVGRVFDMNPLRSAPGCSSVRTPSSTADTPKRLAIGGCFWMRERLPTRSAPSRLRLPKPKPG